MVAIVRESGNQHAAWQRVAGVWAHYATCFANKIVDGAMQAGGCWVSVHIEDENLVGVQSGCPQKPPVIRESRVVRFVATAHR